MTTAVQLAQSVAPGVSLGFKNRIINGDMRIAQRSTGSVTAANGYNTVDRFTYWGSQVSKFTQQQNLNSVTPPVGFSKYMGNSVASAVSIGAADYFFLQQNIEGNNVSDLAWGTSNAKAVTLSFWVYSSVTGAFGGSVENGAATISYPFGYTINSANTWEQKAITVPGPTTGSWATDNTTGVGVNFSLGMGSNSCGTVNTWANTRYLSPTGCVSLVGTNGATFYLTGVQLEVGTAATSFEYRDYGRELIMCQRYFYNRTTGSALIISTPYAGDSANAWLTMPLPTTMRATPSVSSSNWSGTVPTSANPSVDFISFSSGNYNTYLSSSTVVHVSAEL